LCSPASSIWSAPENAYSEYAAFLELARGELAAAATFAARVGKCRHAPSAHDSPRLGASLMAVYASHGEAAALDAAAREALHWSAWLLPAEAMAHECAVTSAAHSVLCETLPQLSSKSYSARLAGRLASKVSVEAVAECARSAPTPDQVLAALARSGPAPRLPAPRGVLRGPARLAMLRRFNAEASAVRSLPPPPPPPQETIWPRFGGVQPVRSLSAGAVPTPARVLPARAATLSQLPTESAAATDPISSFFRGMGFSL
jgi:hypothetical protein